MARDPIDTRAFRTLAPTDANDPPRFGQPTETVRDAVVLSLRLFLAQENAVPALRTSELPTFRKYAVGYGPNTDPYETFANIVQEYPQVLERLPHIAVLNATGTNNSINVGRPMMSPTWYPPRVTSTAPGTYAFAAVASQVSTVTVTTEVIPFAYTVTIQGLAVIYTSVVGDTIETIASNLRANINDAAGLSVSTSVSAAVITITWRERGVAFSLAVSANLSGATVTAASAAQDPNILAYKTKPLLAGGDVWREIESQVVFEPSRFATGTIGVAAAVDVARIINEQALYAHARVVTVGAGTGIELVAGGPLGGVGQRNLIEIVDNGDNAAQVISLARIYNGGPFDGITVASGIVTLSRFAVSFTAAMVGQHVTITNAVNAGNNGTFTILTASTTVITYANADGVDETPNGARIFVAQYDDSNNALRLPQNRFVHSMKLTLTLAVYTEDANSRTEMQDLMLTHWQFWLEQQFFHLLGRGVQNEAYDSEQYQIIVGTEVAYGGETDYPRPSGDVKQRIYEGRLSVPLTLFWYLDRQVTTTAGAPLVLDDANVVLDDTVPPQS